MSASTLVQVQRHKVVKLAVVGAGGVGKTTLIGYLSTGMFIETQMTVGVNIRTLPVEIDTNEKALVTMFDFGGQKQFRFMQGALIQGSQMALLVFDCSDIQTLHQLREWLVLIRQIPNERRLIVGTKIDKVDQIPEDIIRTVASELGTDYVLISSKTGENVDQLAIAIQDMLKA